MRKTNHSVNNSAPLDVILVSFLLLFLQLAMIRWVSSSVRIIAYFSNIILISCFLGLGVGCLVKRRRDLFTAFPWAMLVMTGVSYYFARHGVQNPFEDEYHFGGGGKFGWFAAVPLVFTLNAMIFLPLGQRLAVEMGRLVPLTGYSLNILGSLLGTAAFALLSFLQAPPTVWYLIAFAIAAALMRSSQKRLLAGLAPAVISLWLIGVQCRDTQWSPYNKIQVQPFSSDPARGFRLAANTDYHQMAIPLSRRETEANPSLRDWGRTYDFPYLAAASTPAAVLVLGAGTGNDVAAALRRGARRVEAVELDPLIAELGRDRHPDHPYQDPRVTIFITDARRHLRVARGPYDRIVLGWLDSHRLFSSLSNIRQDNFVYTRESMKALRGLLADDGLLSLSFYAGKPWIGQKIFDMITAAFGHPPHAYSYDSGAYGPDGRMFLASPDAAWRPPPLGPGFVDRTEEYRQGLRAEIPTDDWPFLYYKDRRLSREYGTALVVLALLSILFVGLALPREEWRTADARPFFFLGAGFLLLEVRNITALALIFGSTWLVTSVVIAAVLIMVLAANGAVSRWGARIPEAWAWGGLFLSIALSGLRGTWGGLGLSGAWEAAAVTAVVSLSFLFAGIIFAKRFAAVAAPGTALGFNILGSVLGGLGEYFTLTVGLRGMLVVAFLLYILAALPSSKNPSPSR